MSTVDALKDALSKTDVSTSIRVQFGDSGPIFQLSASEFMAALGVQSTAGTQPTAPTTATVGKKSVLPSPTYDFLRVRAQPSLGAAEVSRYNKGQAFDVLDMTPVQADNHEWVQTADEQGWVALDLTIPATSPDGSSWQFPFTAAQRGLGSSAGGYAPNPGQIDIVRRNNIEFVLVCAYEANQAAGTIQPLRNAGVKNFVFRACIHEKPTTPTRFTDLTLPILKEYAAQLGNQDSMLIAIGNEPNLVQEGWTTAWLNGQDFASWWKEVAATYRQNFPNAKLGFPALSPGGDVPNVRMNETAFITGAMPAIQEADWIGVHYYWQQSDGADINPPVAQWLAWFGNKPILGTEVGPTDANIVSANAVRKAYQVFGANNIPICAWLLTGAGAWHNAAWDEHGIQL